MKTGVKVKSLLQITLVTMAPHPTKTEEEAGGNPTVIITSLSLHYNETNVVHFKVQIIFIEIALQDSVKPVERGAMTHGAHHAQNINNDYMAKIM